MGGLLNSLILKVAALAARQAARELPDLPEKMREEQRERLFKELSRSQVYHFENSRTRGIVLAHCKHDHNVKDLTVPDGVSRIGAGAFEGREFLESIVIPPSVEVIETRAFKRCKNLKSVKLSAGLKYIEDNAFSHTALTEVTIPEGADLSNGAFSECWRLKKAYLPDSMKKISAGIFYNCQELEEVRLPRILQGSICNLFAQCKSLTKIEIPFGTEEIGDWCFEYCDELKEVTIPLTVKKISNRAFLSCKSLEYIYIPDSVKEIERAAVFAGCGQLKKIRLPVGVRIVPKYDKHFDGVFYHCGRLRTIVLGDREFPVTKPPEAEDIMLMHAELAFSGNGKAKAYIGKHIDEVLTAIIGREDVELTDKLLTSGIITRRNVSSEAFDSAIDCAGMTGAHEIYVMLVKYKEEVLGYSTPEERFRL